MSQSLDSLMVPIFSVRPAAAAVLWHEADPEGWQALLEKFGIVRPLVISRKTGRLLSDPPMLDALKRMFRLDCPAPRGIVLDSIGKWRAPAYLIDVEEADEALISLFLSGGIDRRLMPRLKDSAVIEILVSSLERYGPPVAQTFGIDFQELDDILEALASPPDETPSASPPAPSAPRIVGDWDIPMLDLQHQALAAPPLVKWGTLKRGASLEGLLVHFYTDDSKFSALRKSSAPLFAARPAAAIEANFSTSDLDPAALVLYNLYQKRALARQWQEAGIDLMVDMNVSERWLELNMLGIPDGWAAYANRAQSADLAHLDRAYDLAVTRCGPDRQPFYLVYGGGVKARRYCERRGWLWQPEDSDVKRRRTDGT